MSVITDLDVDKARFMRVIRRSWPELRPGTLESYGPSGFRVVLTEADLPVGSVIVTQADHDGIEWIHASVAFTHEDPAYWDLVVLKDAVYGPDREAYQVFAMRSEHVNIHEHALHLWGRADGCRALPAFGSQGTI